MKKFRLVTIVILSLIMQSCHTEEKQLTESQEKELIASAQEIVLKVFEYSNNLDFEKGLEHYSEASGSYYITDGIMHSLDELKKEYREIGPSVERLHNTIESWNAQLVSKDVVNFTLPVHLKLKLAGIPEFEGQLIWTGTVQNQKEGWKIIQSHESWLNCAEIAAALIPENEKPE